MALRLALDTNRYTDLCKGSSEVREAVDFCRYYAMEARQTMSTGARRPLGPIACISPWNFPLAIFTGQIAAALVTGNPVLVKPSSQTPGVARLMGEIFHSAGVPEDVLQLVAGPGNSAPAGRA